MYYRKIYPRPASRGIKVAFTNFSGGINAAADEHLLPQKYAKMAYNFDGSGGALKKGFGIDCLSIPQPDKTAPHRAVLPEAARACRSFYYRRYDKENQKYDDKIIVVGEGLELYYLDVYGESGEFTPVSDFCFQSMPAAINYRLSDEDVIIFSSEDDGMIVWNGVDAPYKIEGAPPITSMCVHYERLFATIDGEKSSLWFSADLDPTNWNISLNEAGFIEMTDERGQLLRVLSFLDYVYVFRNNGIAKVTAYGDQTQFNVSQLYTGTGKIYEGSAVICGDRIIFLAEDGLYVFDGISTYRILDNIRPMFFGGNENAVAAYICGKYYLACRMDFGAERYLCENGSYKNNALIEYNIASRSFNIMRGVDIAHMTIAHTESFSGILVCFNSDELSSRIGMITDKGGLFGQPLKKSWLTPVSDLGFCGREKRLKDIFLLTREDITLKVYVDDEVFEYRISGSGTVTRKKLGLTGTLIGLEFISETQNPYISKPQIEAEVL